MNLRNEVTARMLVRMFLLVRSGSLIVSFEDPVMAEYITIMVINNKTSGESSGHLLFIH